MKNAKIYKIVSSEFDPSKLVTKLKVMNSRPTNGSKITQKLTLDFTYDGCTHFEFFSDISVFKEGYKGGAPELIVDFPLNTEDPFAQREYNQPWVIAKKFFVQLDDELNSRYKNEKWFNGIDGSANTFGRIRGPLNPQTKEPMMKPEDLWYNIIKKSRGNDGNVMGEQMHLKVYNDGKKVEFVNTFNKTALDLEEVKSILHPFRSAMRGTVVCVRPMINKQFKTLSGEVVDIDDEDKVMNVPKVRAKITVHSFAWFMPAIGAGLNFTPDRVEMYVPYYRSKCLSSDLSEKVGPPVPFPEKCEFDWATEYVQQVSLYVGTKRKSEEEAPEDENEN